MRDESRDSNQAVPDGFESWNAYWTAQGMSWRTEPEIDEERQQFLAARHAIDTDVNHGMYPFSDGEHSISLRRADIEWLVARYCYIAASNGRQDGSQHQQFPSYLDLRGASLRGADLSYIPLPGLQGGLEVGQWVLLTPEQASRVVVHFEGANLTGCDLRGASLRGVSLEHANLYKATLADAQLRGAKCSGAFLRETQLQGADLRLVTFDAETSLDDVVFADGASHSALLADVRWNSVSLARVKWFHLTVLGDEVRTRKPIVEWGRSARLVREDAYDGAMRAYNQLAVALRNQGMTDVANRYTYRAQLMQRAILRLRRRYIQYVGSLFIDLLAGYGFRPGRSILMYLAVILWFANFYVWASHGLFSLGLPPSHVQPLAWYEGLILSVSSFHGRGFQPFQNLNDPIAALAGIQAVFGLIIEVSFIATFTQRFFAR